MQLRTFFYALAAATSLVGCASFDPYDVLGRRETSSIAKSEFIPILTGDALRASRAQTVDYVWTTIRDRYYRADLNGVDWIAARAKWEPLILAAPDDNEYWQRVDRMVAELADSHTRVESPTQVEARRNQRVNTLGLSLREVEGKLIVLSVNTDSDAYFAGIRQGMAITKIENEDALPLWKRWIAEARKSSSPQATQRGALRKLNDVARDSPGGIAVEFERADGKRESTRLKRREIATRPTVSYRTLPSGLGYVKLTSFSESLRGELLRGIDSLKDTPGLILDLRGNGGGSLAMADALVGAFFKEKTVIGKASTRDNTPVTLAFGAIKMISLDRSVPGRKDAYAGRVVVLVDQDSASASEYVASALQSTNRANVIGETTCGCLLAFLGYAQLNEGGGLAYSQVGFTSNSNEIIENRGVHPNVEVLRTQDDARVARDRVLEAAMRHLSK
ncbi:MAG: S41 family peptidase [Casimicrobium sp.]